PYPTLFRSQGQELESRQRRGREKGSSPHGSRSVAQAEFHQPRAVRFGSDQAQAGLDGGGAYRGLLRGEVRAEKVVGLLRAQPTQAGADRCQDLGPVFAGQGLAERLHRLQPEHGFDAGRGPRPLLGAARKELLDQGMGEAATGQTPGLASRAGETIEGAEGGAHGGSFHGKAEGSGQVFNLHEGDPSVHAHPVKNFPQAGPRAGRGGVEEREPPATARDPSRSRSDWRNASRVGGHRARHYRRRRSSQLRPSVAPSSQGKPEALQPVSTTRPSASLRPTKPARHSPSSSPQPPRARTSTAAAERFPPAQPRMNSEPGGKPLRKVSKKSGLGRRPSGPMKRKGRLIAPLGWEAAYSSGDRTST